MSQPQWKEIRDPDTFARTYADAHGLDPRARQQLHDRLVDLVTWIRVMRRAAAVGRKVGTNSPVFEQNLRPAMDQTLQLLQRHNGIALHLRVDEVRTPEGFALPWTQDEDFDSHIFYPLARDGVVGLTLLAGMSVQTITGLMEILAKDGRKSGHNALTWLWTLRDPCVAMELGAWLTPRTAHALSAHDRQVASYRAYLRVVSNAGPTMSAGAAPLMSLATMADLADPIWSQVRGERLRDLGAGAGELTPPSPRCRLGFEQAMRDAGSLEKRSQAINLHLRSL
jgi:hypothetical protein